MTALVPAKFAENSAERSVMVQNCANFIATKFAEVSPMMKNRFLIPNSIKFYFI